MESVIEPSIALLAERWGSKYVKKALGGTFAVSGFMYQFHSTLRDCVHAWDRNPTGPQVLSEVLSDLVRLEEDGNWTITQIKQTGRSNTLSQALLDLWTIDCVAADEVPELRDKLRYEVRCSQWELQHVESSIQRWQPAELDRWLEHGDDFICRVTATQDPNPLDELVALLANIVGSQDPYGWVQQWMAELLEHVASGNTAKLAPRLFSDLAATKANNERLPGQLRMVDHNFREPDDVEEGEYLVGQQPRFTHLREGFFARRDWQTIPAAEAFVSWASTDPFRTDTTRRLPVFWIAGRSGSGKSVLLLQLLARLGQTGRYPILWVGNKRALLPDAMSWVRRVCEHGESPIVALDDPYAPGESGDAHEVWTQALEALDRLRDDSDLFPLVIACGPTEQAQRLGQDLVDDVQIHMWSLDESRDEDHLTDLRTWFATRTGTKPPDIEGNVLMVQRFFEWRTGEPLNEFATRFRRRIQDVDSSGRLEPLVATLLAINRLYVGIPVGIVDAMLDGRDMDALERLEQERHISLDHESNGGRPGLWIAHPHLSDALFRGWFGDFQPNERLDAFARSVAWARKYGLTPGEQTGPLWGVLDAWEASETEPLAERIDRDRMGNTLSRIHAEWHEAPDSITLAHLPVWIRLSLAVDGAVFEPSPVTDAIAHIKPDSIKHRGLRLTCHTLLGSLNRLTDSEVPQVLDAVRTLLDIEDWKEWPFISTHLASVTNSPDDAKRLLHAVDAGSHSLHHPKLLSTAFSILPDETLPLILRAANDASVDAWSALFEQVVTYVGTPPLEIWQWVERHRDDQHIPFVLRALLLVGFEDAVPLAQAWLKVNGDSPIANYLIEILIDREDAGAFEENAALRWVSEERVAADRLLEHLLKHTSVADDASRVAQGWLSQHERAVGWPFVFQALVEFMDHGKQRDDLIAGGVLWLEEHKEQSSWNYVFQDLLDVVHDGTQRDDLIASGVLWLEEHKEHSSWNYVFQDLLDVVHDGTQRDDLISKGLRWLDDHDEEQPEWNHVFRKLLDSVPENVNRRAMIHRGLQWLEEHGEEEMEWNPFLQKLLDVVEDRTQRKDLIDRGLTWLPEREKSPEWNFTLEKMLNVVEDNSQRRDLIDRGLSWLQGHEENSEWHYTLQKLLEVVTDSAQRQDLIELGSNWVQGREERPEWPFVFQKLLDVVQDSAQRRDLIELESNWLQGHEERPRWPFVFQKLLDVVQDSAQRRDLIDRGLSWLSGRENHRNWSHVFGAVIDLVIGDEQIDLLDRGLGWLDGREDRADWAYVCRTLLPVSNHFSRRGELIKVALAWLNQRKDRRGWTKLFETVIHHVDRVGRTRLAPIGEEWLKTNLSDSRWQSFLEFCLNEYAGTGDVDRFAAIKVS